MSTFVRQAENVMTSKQRERGSSYNHEPHAAVIDPGNKADTNVMTSTENRESSSGRTPDDNRLDSASGQESGDTAGPHDSKLINKLDPRVDTSKDENLRQQSFNGKIPGWMIA
ncbi:hypothetical protein PENANT_c092G11504 [Penicillium antarcticum]|uniref:Uncharacterized protein n=1 Tax=Penicillium antarcticum TaxID=416450 RepID=A0A1V6PM20_9EURO|nr:uncharacterized protein N7508_011060 [Penicillium antarcticum]KAJ5288285.1 hypothetical protein N7508_011060 [Penicillium antarcticum]OQD78069.1 hypothetical protein PENANT_c092G11504 [Penicillium antarcticum]